MLQTTIDYLEMMAAKFAVDLVVEIQCKTLKPRITRALFLHVMTSLGLGARAFVGWYR